MTASADESSALKRNSVHQTRLSLELQQLEKDRSIRLREMQKASQVFARRQEQIQGVRDKASLRRVTSAPPKKASEKPLKGGNVLSCQTHDDDSPFVTAAKLESEPHKRKLHKTMTMPSLTQLPSRTSSAQCSSASVANPSQQRSVKSGHSKRLASETPVLKKPASCDRMPIYSRNFCGLRQRGNSQASLTGLQSRTYTEKTRRDSIS